MLSSHNNIMLGINPIMSQNNLPFNSNGGLQCATSHLSSPIALRNDFPLRAISGIQSASYSLIPILQYTFPFYNESGMPDFFVQQYLTPDGNTVLTPVRDVAFGSGEHSRRFHCLMNGSTQPYNSHIVAQIPFVPVILVNSLEAALTMQNQLILDGDQSVIWCSWFGDINQVDWRVFSGREVTYLHVSTADQPKVSDCKLQHELGVKLNGIVKSFESVFLTKEESA